MERYAAGARGAPKRKVANRAEEIGNAMVTHQRRLGRAENFRVRRDHGGRSCDLRKTRESGVFACRGFLGWQG